MTNYQLEQMQSEAKLRVIVECIAHEITVPDTFSVPLTGNETHEQMLKKCEEFCYDLYSKEYLEAYEDYLEWKETFNVDSM